MWFKYNVIFAVLFCSVLCSYAGIQQNSNAKSEKINTPKKVLVQLNKERFNDPVVLKVVKLLKKDNCIVKVKAGKVLKGETLKKYNAIIVVNFIKNNNGEGGIRAFVEEEIQKRIVLFNAVGRDYLSQEVNSKSKKERADKIASDIVRKVREIINR